MKKLFELVKTIDTEPFQAGEGDLFRLRREVIRELDTTLYKGKVYRLETYRPQPTFPQSKGRLPILKNDSLIYILDDMFDENHLQGYSVKYVIDKSNKKLIIFKNF